jgi:carbon-monoxide dehydrogenase small subunit
VTLRIRVGVNGSTRELEIPPSRRLIDLLRDDLGLTGTKEGCGVGVCGACTVLLNGRMISSCLALAAFADGAEVTTVEGLADDDRLHPVQQAFIDYGGFQCGICTPGQLVAAKALLDETPSPTADEIRAWMLGNLCRCTGYYKIVESIQNVGGADIAPHTPPRSDRAGEPGALLDSPGGS